MFKWGQVNSFDNAILHILMDRNAMMMANLFEYNLSWWCFIYWLHLSADIIICLDACFIQKCNKTRERGSHQDPPNCHPCSIFMFKADVNVIKDFVGSCWSSHLHYTPASSAEDRYEAGKHVSTSVLNGCNDLFVATDEKREKAST